MIQVCTARVRRELATAPTPQSINPELGNGNRQALLRIFLALSHSYPDRAFRKWRYECAMAHVFWESVGWIHQRFFMPCSRAWNCWRRDATTTRQERNAVRRCLVSWLFIGWRKAWNRWHERVMARNRVRRGVERAIAFQRKKRLEARFREFRAHTWSCHRRLELKLIGVQMRDRFGKLVRILLITQSAQQLALYVCRLFLREQVKAQRNPGPDP